MKHKPTSPVVSEKEFTLEETVSWTCCFSYKDARKHQLQHVTPPFFEKQKYMSSELFVLSSFRCLITLFPIRHASSCSLEMTLRPEEAKVHIGLTQIVFSYSKYPVYAS